jgi:hypothetical protein
MNSLPNSTTWALLVSNSLPRALNLGWPSGVGSFRDLRALRVKAYPGARCRLSAVKQSLVSSFDIDDYMCAVCGMGAGRWVLSALGPESHDDPVIHLPHTLPFSNDHMFSSHSSATLAL